MHHHYVFDGKISITLIKGGGARVNDEPVREEMAKIGPDAVGEQGFFKLSAGKKRHILVRPE